MGYIWMPEKRKVVLHKSTCGMCAGSGRVPRKHPLATGSHCADYVECPYCSGTGETMAYTLEYNGVTG